MTAPARPGARPRGRQGSPDERPAAVRPLAVTGAMAACLVMVTGLVILTPLVLVGWIAAPHAGLGLPGVLRTAAVLWLAGRRVARTGQLTRLSEVGYVALALAAPYAVLCGALALASRSRLATPSLPQAVVAGFLIALCAGGLGAAHLHEFGSLNDALGAGAVGSVLLLLAQLAYVPNAVIWAVCFTLGPGFAFGTGTVVAPTGAALGPLPMFPMLAAMPSGAHPLVPGFVSVAMLIVPYLAGVFGGLLLVRAAPFP